MGQSQIDAPAAASASVAALFPAGDPSGPRQLTPHEFGLRQLRLDRRLQVQLIEPTGDLHKLITNSYWKEMESFSEKSKLKIRPSHQEIHAHCAPNGIVLECHIYLQMRQFSR
jgi:hypothetical protein